MLYFCLFMSRSVPKSSILSWIQTLVPPFHHFCPFGAEVIQWKQPNDRCSSSCSPFLSWRYHHNLYRQRVNLHNNHRQNLQNNHHNNLLHSHLTNPADNHLRSQRVNLSCALQVSPVESPAVNRACNLHSNQQEDQPMNRPGIKKTHHLLWLTKWLPSPGHLSDDHL